MYYYLIIEAKKEPNDQWSFVAAFLEELTEIISINNQPSRMMLIHQRTHPMDFKDMIYNMIAETYQDLRLYQSHAFADIDSLSSHAIYIQKKLEDIPFNVATFTDDRILLRYLLKHDKEIDRLYFLRKYAHNSEMLLTIQTFLDHDQNINQTAAELYIHRNTLLQRLDKFQSLTGFDIKKFQDAFIIYQLL